MHEPGHQLARPLQGPAAQDSPPGDVVSAVRLLDAVDDLLALRHGMHTELFDAMGLRLGQLRVLLALRTGPADIAAIAADLGELPTAVMATVASLLDLGLVAGASPPGRGFIPTEAGRTCIDQATGLHLRRLAALPIDEQQLLTDTAAGLATQLHARPT